MLSVVAPLHNEEDTAATFYSRVKQSLEGLNWELVLVDDGSTDRTADALHEIAESDSRVKVVTLARNFGHQPALSAGMEYATGNVVCTIDADLQDPPELIPEMLARWAAGADVVYAVRKRREGETRFKLLTARWFYRLFARLAPIQMPLDAGDFRLIDRQPLDVLLAMPERNRFLRGMTAWVGHEQSVVEYERESRAAGETKFTLRRMLRFSADALTSFSNVPLQLATLLGFVFSGIAFLLIPVVIAARIFEEFVPGISSTLVALLMLGGIQLITVGIIGEYVGRIYDEVKRRPLYVVKERQNVPEEVPLLRDERRSQAGTGGERGQGDADGKLGESIPGRRA